MNLSLAILLASALALSAETEEKINKQFSVQPGGKLAVDVDVGSIDVRTNATSEIIVDVVRKVGRRSKAAEESFLTEHPVTFSQDGDTITIRCRGQGKGGGWWRGPQRTEGKYTITVPALFNAQLKTSGGAIAVSDLTGQVNAGTSGGALKFNRLHGPLDGRTSGGAIHVSDCEGTLKVNTSGGVIEVTDGAGTLRGDTSGGPVIVRNFRGPVQVGSSGGGIIIENVAGKVTGWTSGGSISALFSSPLSEEVKLVTSGGGVTMRVAGNSAFDLDAFTSGGGVSSDLPVSSAGQTARHQHLKGAVNGGGKPVVLRTSGGNIRVEKL